MTKSKTIRVHPTDKVLTAYQRRVIVGALKLALAVCENEADQRGDEDLKYDTPAGPAVRRLRLALEQIGARQ